MSLDFNQLSNLSFTVDVQTQVVAPEGLSTWDEQTGETTQVNAHVAGQEVPVALVKCLVDGEEPLLSTASRPFDALTFVFYGMEPDEHDFWTCSCGVAGCAGLHDGVQVYVPKDEVHWVFPLCTYQNKFSAEFRNAFNLPAPLDEAERMETIETHLLRFSRSQYEEALRGLKAHLIELKDAHPLLQLAPSTFYENPEESALSHIWDKCAERAEKQGQARALHREVFGAMEKLWLELDTPLGVFRLSPPGWRAAILPNSFWDDSYDETAQAYKDAAPLMVATRNNPMEFVLSLPWDQVCLQASRVVYDENITELPEDAGPEFKAAMKAAWVTLG